MQPLFTTEPIALSFGVLPGRDSDLLETLVTGAFFGQIRFDFLHADRLPYGVGILRQGPHFINRATLKHQRGTKLNPFSQNLPVPG